MTHRLDLGRRLLQGLVGASIGLGVRLVLPGQHSLGFMITIGLSLLGALGAETVAERLLPRDELWVGGFLFSALGAMGSLLVYGLLQ